MLSTALCYSPYAVLPVPNRSSSQTNIGLGAHYQHLQAADFALSETRQTNYKINLQSDCLVSNFGFSPINLPGTRREILSLS
jgi:hypothetical protein